MSEKKGRLFLSSMMENILRIVALEASIHRMGKQTVREARNTGLSKSTLPPGPKAYCLET